MNADLETIAQQLMRDRKANSIEQARAMVAAAQTTPPAPPPPAGWGPGDLIGRGDAPIEPPSISGLLYPGLRHLLSGEAEAGKTWLALAIGAEQVQAGERVWFVDLEQGPRMTLERLRQLGLAESAIRARMTWIEPEKALYGDERDRVEASLDAERPALVIVDSFTALLGLHGMDALKGTDIEQVWGNVIGLLRSRGAAVVIVDHVTKSKEQRGRYSIGSERKLTAADVAIGLEVVRPFGRGQAGVSKLTVHKDRGGYHRRGVYGLVHLTSEPLTGLVSWRIDPDEHDSATATGAWRPTNLMAKVTAHLETCDAPVSRRSVYAAIQSRREHVAAAIDALIADGDVISTEGPRKAELLALADCVPQTRTQSTLEGAS